MWLIAEELLACRPGFIALKLCPELVFVKPNFKRYSEASRAVKDILRLYDPDLESASLDEAHLDVTDYCKNHNLSGEICCCLKVVVQASVLQIFIWRSKVSDLDQRCRSAFQH